MNSPCVPRPNPSAMFDMTDSDESLICSTSRRSRANLSVSVCRKIAFDHLRARCQMSRSVKTWTPMRVSSVLSTQYSVHEHELVQVQDHPARVRQPVPLRVLLQP